MTKKTEKILNRRIKQYEKDISDPKLEPTKRNSFQKPGSLSGRKS